MHSATLPEYVYLDANVVIPAIVDGHPYAAAYWGAIHKLREAGERVGIAPRIIVLRGFLNEIISHRHRAIQIVAEKGLEDPERLARYITYVGADACTVFVASYASHVGRDGQKLAFREYLVIGDDSGTTTTRADRDEQPRKE